jgi:hypothetical protein
MQERTEERFRYCLSYTAMLMTFLPFESIPRIVTVRLFPSVDTSMRPLAVRLPPFLKLKPTARSSR